MGPASLLDTRLEKYAHLLFSCIVKPEPQILLVLYDTSRSDVLSFVPYRALQSDRCVVVSATTDSPRTLTSLF
jgi:hypothetical protein